MVNKKKSIKLWVITKDGTKKAYYSFADDFKAIPLSKMNQFIVSDSEINDTIRRNRMKFKKLEKVYRKRKVR